MERKPLPMNLPMVINGNGQAPPRRPYKPAPGPGRAKGAVNKLSRIIKDAVILAAEQVGENGKGKDGLVGYLRRCARYEMKAFIPLMAKCIPLQVYGDVVQYNLNTEDLKDLSDGQLAALERVFRAVAEGGYKPPDVSAGFGAQEAGDNAYALASNLRASNPTN